MKEFRVHLNMDCDLQIIAEDASRAIEIMQENLDLKVSRNKPITKEEYMEVIDWDVDYDDADIDIDPDGEEEEEWLICGTCNGVGGDIRLGYCPTCKGRGEVAG